MQYQDIKLFFFNQYLILFMVINSAYHKLLRRNNHTKYLVNYTKVQNGIWSVFYACIVIGLISA